MTDWEPKDTIADLREKIATLRGMLRDAHRREETLLKQIDTMENQNETL